MAVVVAEGAAAALLAPVRRVIEAAARPLGPVPVLRVEMGEAPPWSRLAGDLLTLDHSIESSDVAHPLDLAGPLPPIDRWRRAAGLVIEALATRAIEARLGHEADGGWPWVGLAADVADALAPELRIGPADLALALATGDPGRHPRAGAAVWRWFRTRAVDPVDRLGEWLDGGVLSATEWRDVGAWVFDPAGLSARLPMPVGRRPDASVPTRLTPWSWAVVRIEGGQSGAHAVVDGDGAIGDPWVVSGGTIRTVAAAASTPVDVGWGDAVPFGDWVLGSAEAVGQVFGARGLVFRFLDEGRFEAVLGDAFVGPLAALPVAEQVGTSGLVPGRWEVAGASSIQFSRLDASGLTLHGRRSDRFAVPARGLVLTEWLASLGEAPWSWSAAVDRLVLRGRFRGMPVEVRFRREDGAES
jgi:hypothetical protein